MPTVQYQPDQVRTQVQGTVTAREVDNGGMALAQGISDIGKMAGEMKKQADFSATQEASNNFERATNDLFFNPENGYFNTQGRVAYDEGKGVSEQLDKLREQYGKDLSPQARQEFERVANQRITRSNAEIMQHSSKGLKSWDISNLSVEVENQLEQGALEWNNMKMVNDARDRGVQAIYEAGKLLDKGAKEINEDAQNFRSALAMNVIQSATQSSAQDGEVAMEQWGGMLEGPDKTKMLELVEKRGRVENARDKANLAVSRANVLVEKFGDLQNAREAMIAEINKETDPEMQKALKDEATYQLNQKFQADGERRANTVAKAEQFIFAEDNSWQQFEAQFTEEWEDLTVPMRAVLMQGVPIATDYVKFGELSLLSDRDMAATNPADYRHILANTEYKELVRMVKTARGELSQSEFTLQAARTNAATATAGVEIILDKKKSDWSKNETLKANAIYELITSNVGILQEQKGSKLTPTEYTDAVNNIALTYFTKPSSVPWLFGPDEITLDDIPDADIRAITAQARKQGVVVSSEMIVKAYLAKQDN